MSSKGYIEKTYESLVMVSLYSAFFGFLAGYSISNQNHKSHEYKVIEERAKAIAQILCNPTSDKYQEAKRK